MKFYELSWNFEIMNFPENHELSWTAFLKTWNHETLLQGDCAAMEHRCDASSVKSWNLNCSSFYDALLRRWVWSWALSFNRGRRQCYYGSLHKTMTAKNRKTNLNVDTLLESKVATRWSAVNYENRTVRSFYNAWQRKGIWVVGFEEAVSGNSSCGENWGEAPKKAAVEVKSETSWALVKRPSQW